MPLTFTDNPYCSYTIKRKCAISKCEQTVFAFERIVPKAGMYVGSKQIMVEEPESQDSALFYMTGSCVPSTCMAACVATQAMYGGMVRRTPWNKCSTSQRKR